MGEDSPRAQHLGSHHILGRSGFTFGCPVDRVHAASRKKSQLALTCEDHPFDAAAGISYFFLAGLKI